MKYNRSIWGVIGLTLILPVFGRGSSGSEKDRVLLGLEQTVAESVILSILSDLPSIVVPLFELDLRPKSDFSGHLVFLVIVNSQAFGV